MELFLNMMLKNYYYSFKSAIPLRICDDIIKYGTQQKSSLALTGGLQNKINPLTKKLSQKDEKDLNTYGKIRKLSVTVSLSDPSEYKGGELEFDFRNLDPDKKRNVRKCKEILPKGSIVIFPSFCWHRVCPVKSGTRYSLVVWNLGRPYK